MAILHCARCGRRVRKRVVYGYPEPETLERARRGEIVLGGCVLPAGPIENWVCDTCASAETAPEAGAGHDTGRRQQP
jgi:hypothetical protein